MFNAQKSSDIAALALLIDHWSLLIDHWPLLIDCYQASSLLEGNPPPRFSISS
jgi:hypothetical protein